ncbi:MAG: hypothetical protein AB4050_20705 [Synechococcus sp.]
MGELEPAQQKEFDQMAQAELESHSIEQHLKNNVCENFDEIKGGSNSPVEGASAGLTSSVGRVYEKSPAHDW